MAFDIRSVLDNIKQVSLSPSSMEILQEFERVIDENGLYAFANWKTLELVDGPKISAYRVKCTFTSPLTKMPDPAGGERLIPYGAIIEYKKAFMVYPIKVRSESDFRPAIKKPKLIKSPVWLVTIDMPKYLIKDITKGSLEIMDDEIDMDDISDAYTDDLNTHAGVQKAVATQDNNVTTGIPNE
jgi:hypothetical protein